MQLLLVGVNYKSAGLAARETLSFDETARQQLLNHLIRCSSIQEVVLLSTCNRTEVYAITDQPQIAHQSVVGALCAQAGLIAIDELAYTYYNKFAAVHLFEVAAGLDSMVLGENEILRQVKQALNLANQAEACGPVLDQLFRFAIIAGKRVRTETALNEGCASMGALTARVLRQRLAPGSRVLILGAGQMARVLTRNLAETDFQLTFVNRSAAAAEALAAEHTGPSEVLPLQNLVATLTSADAVVACTSAPGYLVRPQMLSDSRPRLLVDLAVPRNLDPALAELPQLTLIDVDGLQASIDATYSQRHQAIGQAQTIIGEETARFLEWFHQRELVPTIRSLYGMFEEIRQRELERGLAKYKDTLDAETEAIVERVTKAITQKILHYPVVRLKTADPERREIYEQALNELFSLQEADGIGKYVALPQASRHPAHS